MWLGLVTVSIFAVLVLFWAVARRVKFFDEESFNQRLAVFPARFKYEVDVIAAEMKALLNARSEKVDEKALMDERKWVEEDESFLEQIAGDVQCPFPIFSVLNEIGEVNEDFEVPEEAYMEPFILRDRMDSWPAMRSERWQRYKLLKSYGKKAISSSSQASIIYGGGRANMKFKSFGRVLLEMRQGQHDSFTFDSDILNSIPELRNDFDVPEVFSDWSNMQAEAAGTSWHMLSLGPSRTGLPFHTHGETWLGLVYGSKMWYFYPPGTGPPPPSVQQPFSPLDSVSHWADVTLPSLRSLPFAPTPRGNTSLPAGEEFYRPLECLQSPGDIMYVPAGWSHQTINVGEAIGVGSQRVFGGQGKLDAADEALQKSPHNVEALKMRAVALSHEAIEEDRRVKRNITAATANGMVRVRGDTGQNSEFRKLVIDGEDSWLLLFMPSRSDSKDDKAPHEALKKLARLWNQVAGAVRGVASVGLVEALDLPQARSSNPLEPKIIASYGDTRRSDMTIADVLRVGEEYKGPREEEALVDFLLQGMARRPKAREGSATTVGAKARRLYSEAEAALRQLLSIQPEHPEALTLLVEVLGYTRSSDKQRRAAEEAASVFESLLERTDKEASASSTYSTVAAFYHLLASCFLANENPRAALPYLFRSKEISPGYFGAMVDIVGAYYMIGDEEKAAMAIQAAKEAGVPESHPEMRRIHTLKKKQNTGMSEGELGPPPRRMKTRMNNEL